MEKLLKSKDAARCLSVSEKTLWNLTNAGQVRSVRMGRLVRYDPDDLKNFIEKSKTEIS